MLHARWLPQGTLNRQRTTHYSTGHALAGGRLAASQMLGCLRGQTWQQSDDIACCDAGSTRRDSRAQPAAAVQRLVQWATWTPCWASQKCLAAALHALSGHDKAGSGHWRGFSGQDKAWGRSKACQNRSLTLPCCAQHPPGLFEKATQTPNLFMNPLRKLKT